MKIKGLALKIVSSAALVVMAFSSQAFAADNTAKTHTHGDRSHSHAHNEATHSHNAGLVSQYNNAQQATVVTAPVQTHTTTVVYADPGYYYNPHSSFYYGFGHYSRNQYRGSRSHKRSNRFNRSNRHQIKSHNRGNRFKSSNRSNRSKGGNRSRSRR